MLSFLKKYFLKEITWFFCLAILAALLFHEGFFMFFHQDDFIQASFSQTLPKVLKAFNIFSKADLPFYRPLSSQIYFYFGLKLFGFNSLPFHLINFSLLILNSYLLFRLGKVINFRKSTSILASFFYTLNSTHVAPMFSAAYVQELLLTTFSLLTISFFVQSFSKKKKFGCLCMTLIFFVFSLMTKETAVIVPILSVLALILSKNSFSLKKLFLSMVPFAFILLVYGIGHFFFYGLPKSSSYVFEFGKPTINILVWYGLWAMSVPPILIDFIGPKFTINPYLWQVGGINMPIFFTFFSLFISSLVFLSVIFKEKKKLAILTVWFIIGVLPVLPFPKHHLAIEQTLSLIGLSFLVGMVFSKRYFDKGLARFLSIVGLICYLVVVFNSVNLAGKTHYSATGSRLVWRMFTYLKSLPGDVFENKILYFKDGKILVPQYGSSKQISLAFGGDRGFKLLFKQPNLQVYFEDGNPLPKDLQENKNVIEIDSSEFLYK